MEQAGFIFLIAILVESAVEWLKELIKGPLQWPRILALGLALVLLFILDLDIFVLAGRDTGVPFLGTFLLALVVSRGAGYAHEFLDRIGAWRKG